MVVRQLRDLASVIKSARKRKGWSQATLAEAVGCTQTTISKIESGADAAIYTVIRVCSALQLIVEINELQAKDDSNSNEVKW